ncbi:MAG: hypothetical protein LW690_11060 [Opitutaceae bacterium]|nr:hypothetical protein [Opitutaceae bacterium]
MKNKSPFLVLFFVLFSAGLRGELEFSAFLVLPKSELFVLRDKEQDQGSGFLHLGQSFRGYTLKSFDKNREVITVQKNGQDLEIRLKESKIQDGKLTVEGAISFLNGQELEGVRVSLFIGEESVIPISETVRLAITPTRMADGNMKYAVRFITMTEGKEEVVSCPTVVALPGSPFAVKVGEYGYRFAPQP